MVGLPYDIILVYALVQTLLTRARNLGAVTMCFEAMHWNFGSVHVYNSQRVVAQELLRRTAARNNVHLRGLPTHIPLRELEPNDYESEGYRPKGPMQIGRIANRSA